MKKKSKRPRRIKVLCGWGYHYLTQEKAARVKGCKVLRPPDFDQQYVGKEGSSCFYYKPFDILGRYVRFCRIEVKDKKAPLHKHEGATLVLVTAGSGIFKKESGRSVRVRQGDMIYVPPNTAHLSIADKNTTMIEHVVYIGDEGDRQKSVPVRT
jgi:mannose-6-phosphate isomerase-like protein (cupin superfamily)